MSSHVCSICRICGQCHICKKYGVALISHIVEEGTTNAVNNLMTDTNDQTPVHNIVTANNMAYEIKIKTYARTLNAPLRICVFETIALFKTINNVVSLVQQDISDLCDDNVPWSIVFNTSGLTVSVNVIGEDNINISWDSSYKITSF